MDDEIETLLVQVRADTAGFAQDVAVLRGQIDGPLADGLDRAGRALDAALSAAIRRGSLGFEDLRRVALAVLADIASAAIKAGIDQIGGGGLLSIGTSLLGGLLGAPGRATGGPVSPGRAYRVGENGPELFVPTSSGRIEPHVAAQVRDVRMTINVIGATGQSSAEALQRSGRQVAKAVKRALSG